MKSKIRKAQYGIWICFLWVLISCSQPSLSKQQVNATQQKIDTTLATQKDIDSFIQPYRSHLQATLDEVIAYAPKDLTKDDGTWESSLGNLIADIVLEQVQPYFKKRYQEDIDFVLLTYGGVRAPIPKGEVTARNAFQIMPFNNELVVLELTAQDVVAMCEYFARDKKAHPVSNIQLVFDPKSEKEPRMSIGGEPFSKEKTYKVLTIDYLHKGGDRMDFLQHPKRVYATDYKIRNTLIDYFKKVDTLQATKDNRVRYAE